MKLVLIGIQGSGKSTQGNLLSAKLNIPYLSTGHIFRQMAKEKTAMGQYIKNTLNAGVLIPDDLTIKVVNEYLSRPEYKNGYILDGFPRTLEQAKKFRNHVDLVIYLNVPDQEALWRIAHRNDTSREDETLLAIKKRIAMFHEKTTPVIQYYRKKDQLFEVNGSKSIEEIHKRIMEFLHQVLGEEKFQSIKEMQKKRPKVILGVVGLAGSGKTEACNFFRKKGLPVISFGDVINDYVDNHKLAHTEEIHKKLRNEFREKYGLECMAKLNEEKINKALKKNPLLIIESLYTWEEYLFLKKAFPNCRVLLLALFADKSIRYSRVAQRSYRPGVGGEERDLNELTQIKKAEPIAFADFTVLNRDSLSDLHEKLEGIYRKIYYGMI